MKDLSRYSQYTAIDFVMDDYFKEWVQRPTPETDLFWQHWLTENPGKKTDIEEARQIIMRMNFRVDTFSTESSRRLWHLLENTYDHQIQADTKNGSALNLKAVTHQKKSWNYSYKIAATVTAFILVSAALYFFFQSYSTITYTTAFGQTQTITLPDQSVVTLNANSILKLPRNWSDQQREVWLQGEAFFSVSNKQDGKTKFTVHTTSLDIEVLGTSFNVNNRRNNTTVVLNSGKVKLKTGKTISADSLIMKPGEQVIFSEEKLAFTKKTVNPENSSSWIHQKLIFEETPLSQIAQLLEDNYGFQVRFKQADLANRKFTATIPAGNINTLLTAISESFHIQITRQGKELTFK